VSGEKSQERRIVYYSGRVQGVGFRYTVRELAARFPVVGYVKNLPDGRVELVVEGEATGIDELCKAIRSHMGRHILGESEQVSSPLGSFDHFEVRF